MSAQNYKHPGIRYHWLILFAVLSWALVIRFGPFLLLVDGHTIYHSGGLFYAFASAIREGDFSFPHTISHYTLGGLPYAYPPLAFYGEALIQAFFKAGPNSILVLNAVFSALAVGAFGLLAYAITELSYGGKWMAMLAFATLPSTYLEHLPGEGLAESLGTLVFIALLRELIRRPALERTINHQIVLGGLLGLNVLASPGTAYAAPVLVVLWLITHLATGWDIRKWKKLCVNIGFALGIGLIVAAPYLLMTINHHGIKVFLDPFLNENSSVGLVIFNAFDVFTMRIYEGIVVPPLGQILAVWGLVYVIIQKHTFLLLALLFLIFVPREGIWLSAVFLALLAGLGWDYILLPGLKSLSNSPLSTERQPAVEKALILLVVFFGVLSPVFTLMIYGAGDVLYQDHIEPGELAAIDKIRADIPSNATFIVFANEIEWFPLLAERTTLNVEYGTEWVPQKRKAVLNNNMRLDECTTASELMDLLHEMNREEPHVFPVPDYLYLSKTQGARRGNPTAQTGLIEDLKDSPDFSIFFENEQVLVMAVNGGPISDTEVHSTKSNRNIRPPIPAGAS